MIKHPILIIEDDNDDRELIQMAFEELVVENELKYFNNGSEALEYLQSTSEQTFIIFSDINMPLLDGFNLKKTIDRDPKLKKQAIPFVFLTTSDRKIDIEMAYDLAVQGYFTKPGSYAQLLAILKSAIDYWYKAQTPSVQHAKF